MGYVNGVRYTSGTFYTLTSKIHLFRTLQLFLFRTTTVFGACVFALKGPKLRKNFT